MRIGIIGGGASGIASAITAARSNRHAEVFILEQKEKIGRKILATGNGRCNLTNRRMEASCIDSCYHSEDISFVKEVLKQFGYQDTLNFFESVGLVTRARGDYVYPRSDQAATVLELLELELKRLGVMVHCGVKIRSIVRKEEEFNLKADKMAINRPKSKKSIQERPKGRGNSQDEGLFFRADRIILACGGKAAPVFGSDGSGYQLVKSFGHHLTPVVPALVQLKVKNHPFAKAAGVRTEAKVTALIDGIPAAADTGELQITAYGISGIPVFQISRHIALGLYRRKRAEVLMDLLPEYSDKETAMLLARIAERWQGLTVGECLSGIFNQKLIPMILEQAKIRTQTRISELNDRQFQELAGKCKRILLSIQDTNGFENAQVCAGGVKTTEIRPRTMESKYVKGLYLTGELLDTDGICGGYNLQWAWATGCIAGKAASAKFK